MPDWFFPLISLLATIVLALIGCIITMVYWGGTVMAKVESLDRHFLALSENLQKEIGKREMEITAEREKREADIRSVWKRIDELREMIAAKIHG